MKLLGRNCTITGRAFFRIRESVDNTQMVFIWKKRGCKAT
jgi:hypothetical protein